MPLVSLARLKPPSDKASSGERLLQNILLHWPRGPWRLSVSGISPWRFHEPLLMIILKNPGTRGSAFLPIILYATGGHIFRPCPATDSDSSLRSLIPQLCTK